MKVFVSWSGDASRQAAELMRQWLPRVVQETEIWVSSRDIGKGERWGPALFEQLSAIEFGLLMVTKENLGSPWLMFEAGALSKTVAARVIPILCDVNVLDLTSTPLSQFQNATKVTKDEIREVVYSVNTVAERPLDQLRLDTTFDKWWPDFEDAFGKISFSPQVTPNEASEGTRLEKIEAAVEQILATMRSRSASSFVTQGLVRDAVVSARPGKHEVDTFLNLEKYAAQLVEERVPAEVALRQIRAHARASGLRVDRIGYDEQAFRATMGSHSWTVPRS